MLVNIITEKPGWITHRMARELSLGFKQCSLVFGLKAKFRFLMNFKQVKNSNLPDQIDYYLPYYLMPKKVSQNVINVVCVTHLELTSDFKRRGLENCLKNADFFVTVSAFTANQLLDYGVDKNKIQIINYGVDTLYKPYFNILLVGAAGKRKGLNFLKELMNFFSEDESIRWLSASETGWGIDTLGLNATDLRIAYAWADILIVTSDLEGAHTGTLEALYSGLKVLSRPVGWAANELSDFVETYETVSAMANRIRKLQVEKKRVIYPRYDDLDSRGFSYENWRNEHKLLFANLTQL